MADQNRQLRLTEILRKAHGLQVALVLAGFWCLMMVGVVDRSPTFDEPVYMVGASAAWRLHDFRMNPENGILPQRLAGLALVGVQPPDPKSPAFRASEEWDVARQFFDQPTLGPRSPALLYARIAMSLLAVAFALAVYLISRSLYGHGGGMLSLFLAVLCPTVLAHGPLVTADMAVALFLLLGSWTTWLAHRQATVVRVLGSGLLMGCALTAKMSGMLVVPVAAAMAILAVFGPATEAEASPTRARRLRKAIGILLAQLMLAGLVVWACFDFRYAMMGGVAGGVDKLRIPWSELSSGTVTSWLLAHARAAHVLPEAFLYGFAFQAEIGPATVEHARPAFMHGLVSNLGWPEFFPYAFAIKTPLPTLAVLAASCAVGLRRVRDRRLLGPSLARTAPLVALLVIYGGVAIISRLNSGIRHLLPLHGPALVLAGALWPPREIGKWLRIAIAVCVGLLLADVGLASPDHLAYFNQLTGSPRNRWRHLVDSSLDWGQDLPALVRAVDRTEGDVYLSYYGSLGPRRYGIRGVLLPSYLGVDRTPACILEVQYAGESADATMARAAAAWPEHETTGWLSRGGQRLLVLFKRPQTLDLGAGTYFISATMVQPLYYTAGAERSPAATSDRYRQLTTELGPAMPKQGKPRLDSLLARHEPAELSALVRELEWLRFARLTAYLRGRTPDDDIHHSILVYRLSSAEVERALGDYR
jgi:hypothetical protein